MGDKREDLADELTCTQSDGPLYGLIHGKLEVYETMWARWDGEMPTKEAHHVLYPGTYDMKAMPKLKLIRPTP